MGSSGAGMAVLVGLVLVVAGVFLCVVCVVACVKIIQIAEDVRYIRSKSDIHVKRPMSTSKILGICALVTVCLIFLVLTFAAGAVSGLSQFTSLSR